MFSKTDTRSFAGARRGLRLLIAAVILLATSCASTPLIRTPNGIAALEQMTIGGVTQWVLMRGNDRCLPVLLYLHGGPGMPGIPFEHGMRALEEHFIVVMWDQRGAGKSFRDDIPKESMTIHQFVSDTTELVRLLLKRFQQEKLYLVGHSWGSILGLLTVQAHPELFYAYIGVGQIANMERNEKISYDFVLAKARATKNEKAQAELSAISPPYRGRVDDLLIQRKWLKEFGGMLYGESNFDKLVAVALASSEYTLGDLLRIEPGSLFTTRCLWDEMTSVDFLARPPKIDVPAYFFTGRHDYNTPFELSVELYEKLDAPRGKQMIWFEKSAHIIILEEPERFINVLVYSVLPETYGRTP